MAICHELAIPVIPYGTGTGMEGQVTAPQGGTAQVLGSSAPSWASGPRDPSDVACGSQATRQHRHVMLDSRIPTSATGC